MSNESSAASLAAASSTGAMRAPLAERGDDCYVIEGVRVRRSRILDRHLARLHVFANRLTRMHRQNWDGRRAGSRTAFAWFVFLRDHRGPILLDRIRWRPSHAGAAP